jgi:hypothetical protein
MAEIWYETEVEANSPAEAKEIAAKNTVDLEWEQLLESTEFTDNWEVEE